MGNDFERLICAVEFFEFWLICVASVICGNWTILSIKILLFALDAAFLITDVILNISIKASEAAKNIIGFVHNFDEILLVSLGRKIVEFFSWPFKVN